MGKRIQVNAGDRYGQLQIVKEIEPITDSKGRHIRTMRCKCDCGDNVSVRLSDMRSGHTSSCGCIHKSSVANIGRRNRIHGMTDSPTWKTWKSMRDRCCDYRHKDYSNYGGRGISICDRWRESFQDFLSDMGERPESMSIERIDNDGNYEPSNCCWANNEQQGRNRRTNRVLTLDGRSMCMKDWSLETGISDQTIHHRLKAGWTVKRALTEPVRKRLKRRASP